MVLGKPSSPRRSSSALRVLYNVSTVQLGSPAMSSSPRYTDGPTPWEIEALTLGILLGDLPEIREAVDELVRAVDRD